MSDTNEAAQTSEERTVTVCSKCLQASCWQGVFLCSEAQDAGTVEKTVRELIELNLEHPDYWNTDED